MQPFIDSLKPLSLYGSNYTSCIKIAGIPILPPLITDEYKISLLEYKTEALKVEQRLRCNFELRKNYEQQQRSVSNADLNISSDSSGVFSKSVDSSHQDNNQRFKVTVSPCQSDQCGYAFTSNCGSKNLSCDGLSPDKNPVYEMESSPNKANHLLNNENICSKSCSETPIIGDGSNHHPIEKTCSSSSPIYDHNSYEENDSSQFENSCTMSVSDNSVLQMLPETNKNNTLVNSVTEVLKINQKNLNLSPCKDLVLKSDVLNALCRGQISIRGEKRDLNLSKDFYSFNDTQKVPENSDDDKDIISSDSKKQIKDIIHNKSTINDSGVKTPEIIKTPPKLVRQNSYTLDNPSPELIAFFAKEQQTLFNKTPGLLKRTHTWTVTSDEDEKKNTSTNFKPFTSPNENKKKSRKYWNVEEAKQKWNKKKRDVPLEITKVDCINNSNSDKINKKSKEIEQHNYKISTKSMPQAQSTDCVFSLINNSSKNYKPNRCTEKKIVSPHVSVKSHDDNNFHRLNENSYERSLRLENINRRDNLSTAVLTPEKDTEEFDCSFHDVPYSTRSSGSGDCMSVNPVNDDSISLGSSVSLSTYTSALNSFNKVLPSSDQAAFICNDIVLQFSKQMEDLFKKQVEKLHTLINVSRPASSASSCVASSPPIISSGSYQNKTPSPKCLSASNRLSTELASSQARSCSRRLKFGNNGYKKCPLEYTSEERKAAVIITAYAKGYLVRRLFKTEKVQQIIKSITDSIQCASNFDYSNQSNWTQSDIDLHERLIVQIEAASFSFRDVFSLPINDKMAIIRADRLRKRSTKLQPAKPVLSAATQRVIMRKNMRGATVAKSNPSEKSSSKLRQRRRSFTGFSHMSNSSSNVQPTQPVQLQKSSSTSSANRQPWR